MPIILTNNFPPEVGGVQTMLYELAKNMQLLGAEIMVVAPKVAGAQEFDAACPFPVERYEGSSRLLARLRMIEGVRKALQRVRDRRIIASGWSPAGLAVCMLPPWLQKSYVVLTYGMELDAYRPGIKRPLLRYIYAKSYGAIPISSYTEQLLTKVGVRVIREIVPPGITPHNFLREPTLHPTILSVGRLVERKGFDVTLEAVRRLLPEFPQLRYEIVGHGPDEVRLRRLSSKLGLDQHVQFLGKATEAQKSAAYARAWCFALPVRRIDGDVEGFGIVYLEAAMAGLAAVGGIESGAVDAIEDQKTGLVVDGHNGDAVYNALRLLLSDRVYADQLGAYGKIRALRDFSWETVSRKMISVVEASMPYNALDAIPAEKGFPTKSL